MTPTRTRAAFTLIEMLACIVIMAIVAGLVMVSLRGRSRAAALSQAVEQVMHEDALARQQAQRPGSPVELRIDLASGDRLAISRPSRDGRVETSSLRLPEGCRIERIRVGGRWLDQGEVAIPCNPQGRTPSYALALSAKDQPRQWLVVAGLTGEIQKVADERQVENIFQLVAASHDAD